MILTILRPGVRRHPVTKTFALTDYISVSHLDVHGTYRMADILSWEDQAKLARWANMMEKREEDEFTRRRHGRI